MMSFDDILPSKKFFGGDPPKHQQQKHQQQKHQQQNQQPKNINLNKNFKQSVNKQTNVISTNTETNIKEEPKTNTKPYDYTVPIQQNLVAPTKYPFKPANNYYQSSNTGAKGANKYSNQSFNKYQKPFNNQSNSFGNQSNSFGNQTNSFGNQTNSFGNQTNSFGNQNKTSQNNKQKHYIKPADKSDNSSSFKPNRQINKYNREDDTPINTTQEALFTPITKIDKLNAPIIEQPQQIDSRVTPIREIIYEVPRVENRYIIANDNPYQNINRLNFLYEDFIPDPLMPDKILSVNDRFNLGEFISNNVLSLFEKENDKYYLGKADQQIIKSLYTNEIDGLSKIFSKIKSLKLNPNFEINNNMPKNFMIFKSCYPIRKTDSGVQCSKASQSVNLRIYKTPLYTEEDEIDGIKYNKITKIPDYCHIYDELDYYIQINNIIKSKESPNFPICYGIVKNIYDKTITFEKKEPTELKITSTDDNYDIQMKNMISTAKLAYDYLKDYIIKNHPEVDKTKIEENTNKLKKSMDDNFTAYSSINLKTTDKERILIYKKSMTSKLRMYLDQLFRVFNFRDFEKWKIEKGTTPAPTIETVKLLNSDGELVDVHKSELSNVITFSLCESPDWSYKEWTNPQTIRQYGVAKMIESGWHTDEEKEIFTFQLLYALLVMLKNKIYIPKFGIDNIFIKKIKTSDMQTKIFVYEIDGIKYYIPNKGFYVMIDQRYASSTDEIDQYEIDPDHKNNVKINDDAYEDSIKDMIINTITSILTNESYICKKRIPTTTYKGNLIKTDDYNECINTIRNLIIHNFMKYANNRNGTIISADEFRLINGNIKPLINYECGELVLESIDNNTRYRIAQIVSLPDDASDEVELQTKNDSNEMKIDTVKIINLYSVKNNSLFKQIKDKYIRSDDNIIETYSISTAEALAAL